MGNEICMNIEFQPRSKEETGDPLKLKGDSLTWLWSSEDAGTKATVEEPEHDQATAKTAA